jgi:uncharacterized protein (DUF2126 family)
MATKKNVNEAAVSEFDDERVTVFLPPANDNEDNFKLVGVNGEMIKIQRGVAVQIPKPFKAALDNSRVAYKVLEANKAKASKRV